MDNWQHLDWQAVASWPELEQHLGDRPPRFFSRYVEKLIWGAQFADEDVFVLGSESCGLPESLWTPNAHRCLKLPMREVARSLNLASTVNGAV